jgi:hypothetical protein
MFSFFSHAWMERNGALHGHDQEDCIKIKRARLLRKVDGIFLVKERLLAADRAEVYRQQRRYFQNCHLFELQNYVSFAEAILTAAIRRSAELPTGQTTITQYFTSRINPPTLDDTRPT